MSAFGWFVGCPVPWAAAAGEMEVERCLVHEAEWRDLVVRTAGLALGIGVVVPLGAVALCARERRLRRLEVAEEDDVLRLAVRVHVPECGVVADQEALARPAFLFGEAQAVVAAHRAVEEVVLDQEVAEWMRTVVRVAPAADEDVVISATLESVGADRDADPAPDLKAFRVCLGVCLAGVVEANAFDQDLRRHAPVEACDLAVRVLIRADVAPEDAHVPRSVDVEEPHVQVPERLVHAEPGLPQGRLQASQLHVRCLDQELSVDRDARATRGAEDDVGRARLAGIGADRLSRVPAGRDLDDLPGARTPVRLIEARARTRSGAGIAVRAGRRDV